MTSNINVKIATRIAKNKKERCFLGKLRKYNVPIVSKNSKKVI
jgi:hypothetical protein